MLKEYKERDLEFGRQLKTNLTDHESEKQHGWKKQKSEKEVAGETQGGLLLLGEVRISQLKSFRGKGEMKMVCVSASISVREQERGEEKETGCSC